LITVSCKLATGYRLVTYSVSSDTKAHENVSQGKLTRNIKGIFW
jgi:hypothetical protein